MLLQNQVKGIVQSMLARQGVTRWGIVSSINPNIPAAKVMIQPENIETGWLPVQCGAAGGGANIIALPVQGDQVLLHPDCGEMEHGIVSMACHGGSNQPPVSPATGKVPQPGEIFLSTAGGAYIHLVGNTIYSGATTWIHTGAITATGNVTAGQGSADQVDIQNHKHLYTPGTLTNALTATPKAGT